MTLMLATELVLAAILVGCVLLAIWTTPDKQDRWHETDSRRRSPWWRRRG